MKLEKLISVNNDEQLNDKDLKQKVVKNQKTQP